MSSRLGYYINSVILFFISILFADECPAVPFYYLAFNNLNQVTQQLSVRSITQDHDNVIWLATESGLYSYDGYLLRSHELKIDTPSRPNGNFSIEGLNCILADGDSLLIGCNSGVVVFNLIDHSAFRLQYAQTETVNAIYRHQDQLWVVSENTVYCNQQRIPLHSSNITGSCLGFSGILIGSSDGTCLISYSDFHVADIDAPITKPKTFLPVYQNGMLWIGNEDKVILWDDSNQKVVFETSIPVAKKLEADRQGNILICTDNGLYIVNPQREVSVVQHDARSLTSLAGDVVWNLFFDTDNNLWIATNCGISFVCYRPRLLRLPLPLVTGLGQGNQIFCIYLDSKGRFWFGGTNGIICIDDYRRNFRQCRWYKMGDEKYPIQHNRIRTITEDSTGRIWVGGDGGLMCYDETTMQFSRLLIPEDDNNWIYNIQEGDEGNLQITTYNASYLGTPDFINHRFDVSLQFNRMSLNIHNQQNALRQMDLADHFYCYWHDTLTNRYFLGGLDELGLYNPNRQTNEHSLLLTDIRIDDIRYVKHSDIVRRSVSFEPADHVIEFFFSDFDYSDQFSGYYFFKLSSNGDWYPIPHNDRSLVLTNLSPGDYELYIRHAETAEADARDMEPLLHFRVVPPWYETFQARALFLIITLILVGALYSFIKQHRHQLVEHRHHASQLILARKKEDELKSSNEYLENQLRARMREELGEPEKMSSDDKFLAEITSIIQEHLDDSELNVQRLSELSGIGSKQLYRRIKQLTGLTTVAYIRDLRLKRAAILLADQKYTVSEVMYRVGFTCPSYFARCFCDAYGKSPSEYQPNNLPEPTAEREDAQ